MKPSSISVMSLVLLLSPALPGCAVPPAPPTAARVACPSPTAPMLERDLTVPWPQRTYVMAEGGPPCRPPAVE
ncbi:MAG: hypothetical protein U1F76_22955 [Candidatus Competibacteraceae bacterium]